MWGSGVSAGGGGTGGGGGLSPRATGWGNYRDTAYDSVTPFALAADTRTQLPNNAGSKDETQIPEDMATFYQPGTGKILGTNKSDFILTVRLKAVPREPEATRLTLELEIINAGSPLVIEASSRAIPWGIDQTVALTFTFSGYVRDAFEASGAKLYVTSDGDVDLYGMSYVIKRTHKGV